MTASLELTDANIKRIILFVRDQRQKGEHADDAIRRALEEERDRTTTFVVTVRASVEGAAYDAMVTSLTKAGLLYSIERSLT